MVINTNVEIDNEVLYEKIKLIGNKSIFRLLELTQNKSLSIAELRKDIGLSYGRLEDYVSILYKLNLIDKERDGKIIRIKSKIDLEKIKV